MVCHGRNLDEASDKRHIKGSGHDEHYIVAVDLPCIVFELEKVLGAVVQQSLEKNEHFGGIVSSPRW